MLIVEIKGLDPIVARLKGVSARLPELTMAIAELVRGQTRDRFASTKTAPDGSAWAPWLHDYPRSGSLLVRSGSLAGSIYADAVGLEARIGTNIFYGRYHQEGTKKMVARPFLGLSSNDEKQILSAINGFITDILS